MLSNKMEEIYSSVPPEHIPWNLDTPPDALVELFKSGKISPCKTIDLGCGTGNYALYLAKMGFDVTGIDISPSAIKMAKKNAGSKALNPSFISADMLGELKEFTEPFDFAYDWEVLHHIFPEDRKKYLKNVHRILSSGGKYLSVCFSEKDPHFGGSGKYRETPLGTVLYFSSEDELKDLFSPHFHILDLKTIELIGKIEPHLANYVFMEKKDSHTFKY